MIRPAAGRALALGLALSLSLLGPSAAGAEETAQALLHRGMAERRAGEHDKAAADFSRAFDLSGEPNYLFLLGETQREAGLVKEALAAYRRYLELSPKAPDAAVARDHIEALAQQPRIPAAQIKVPPAAPPAQIKVPAPIVEELPAAPPPLVLGRGQAPPSEAVPLHRRPWLWVAVGAAAAGGLALGLGLGLRPGAPSFFVAPGAAP